MILAAFAFTCLAASAAAGMGIIRTEISAALFLFGLCAGSAEFGNPAAALAVACAGAFAGMPANGIGDLFNEKAELPDVGSIATALSDIGSGGGTCLCQWRGRQFELQARTRRGMVQRGASCVIEGNKDGIMVVRAA